MSNEPRQSGTRPGAPRPRRALRWMRKLVYATGGLAVLLAVLCVGIIEGNVLRGNYPSFMRDLSWTLGEQEHIYNFGSVLPGQIYRSGQPDTRFIDYVVRNYGVRHIITLNGNPPNEDPEVYKLGVTFRIYDWDKDDLPTREEFREVVEMLDGGEPVLVHCTGGKDRTGFLVAGYRVLELGWPVEKALAEMQDFGHQPEHYPEALEYFMGLVDLKVSSARENLAAARNPRSDKAGAGL